MFKKNLILLLLTVVVFIQQVPPAFTQTDQTKPVVMLKVTGVVGKNVYALVKNEKGETVKVAVKPGDSFPAGTEFQVPAGAPNLILTGSDGLDYVAFAFKPEFEEEEGYEAVVIAQDQDNSNIEETIREVSKAASPT